MSNRDMGYSVDLALTVFLGLGTMGDMADIPQPHTPPRTLLLVQPIPGTLQVF